MWQDTKQLQKNSEPQKSIAERSPNVRQIKGAGPRMRNKKTVENGKKKSPAQWGAKVMQEAEGWVPDVFNLGSCPTATSIGGSPKTVTF